MAVGFPAARPRRLRRTAALRRLAARTGVRGSDLVLPMFVKEGISEPEPVPSMPGVAQHTRDSLRKAAAEPRASLTAGMPNSISPPTTRTGSSSWRWPTWPARWETPPS